jgi:predicted RNA methylase
LTTNAEHWDLVYASRSDEQLSWHEVTPVTSLRLLATAARMDHASVIDVGAGTSQLATLLLDTGWTDVTVMDVSAEASAHGGRPHRGSETHGGGG